jgi:transcriptional regulator with XRE-family HTH domain
MEISERIKYLMKLNNLTASAFADEIGVQRSSISHILSGRNKPSLDIVVKILTRFPNVSSDWLLLGKKNVTNVNNVEKETENTEIHNELTNVNQFKTDVNGSFESVENKEFTNVISKGEGKNIEKIVFFYTDGTFKIYRNDID